MFRPLKLIISGIYIGIASILPGIRSGIITTKLGLSTHINEALGYVLRTPFRSKNQFNILIPIAIGFIIALKTGSSTLDYWMITYTNPTLWFFIGLVVASVPTLLRKHRHMRITPGRFIALITPLLIMIALTLIKVPGQYGTIHNTPLIMLAAYGIIIAGAIVIPGMSATPLLLLMGTYSDLVGSMIHINLKIIFIVGLGTLIGLPILSKLINYWIKSYPATSYYAIVGLVLGCVFSMYPGISFSFEGIVHILPVFAGYSIARRLS